MISTHRGMELPMNVSIISGSVKSRPISRSNPANARPAMRSLSTSTPSQSKMTRS